MSASPTIVWFRRDLRLADHASLSEAAARGPVIALFIRDALVDGLGAAPKWRLGQGIAALSAQLQALGSRLILRSGDPVAVLRDVVAETGALAVFWQRAYDPASVARDTGVKAALRADGIMARSHAGHILFEPWTVETKTGGFYRVYTPYWKAVAGRAVADLIPAPARLSPPAVWPASEVLSDWHLGRAMQRGAGVLADYACVGEAAAQDRLAQFITRRLHDYASARDRPACPGTSGLSENLAVGEISPARCWHAAQSALYAGNPGAEMFLKELVWRDFAYHLMFHTPHLLTGNWRPEWDSFPWTHDPDAPDLRAWQQGRTGVAFVDAAMREMYVTGRMHNRGRMIVASLLTKHLMIHWQAGLAWFEECLTDWDPASNAMGWQWAAGSGPDAAPYFRVFNPVSQLDKFDKNHDYPGRWIAEGHHRPAPDALRYFEAIPRSWGLRPDQPYPAPIVDLAQGRARALAAYANRSGAASPPNAPTAGA